MLRLRGAGAHPEQYSFQMSGGMNQRLVSALGLACRPGWVIADEPTKGLDAVIRKPGVLRPAPDLHRAPL